MLKPAMKKHAPVFIYIALVCIGFLSLFAAECRILGSLIKNVQSDYRQTAKDRSMALNFTMNEMLHLSQMLMLNGDILRFVNQPPITEGSPDIQTLIDAQRQLAYVSSIHSQLERLYVYSKKSDYLLASDNAVFDIDRMYEALFAFKGLNSGQWRSAYLRPNHTNKSFAATEVLINGKQRLVLPLVHSLPVTNPAANTGKIILLLKQAFFDILAEPVCASGGWICMLDNQNTIIYEAGMNPIIDEGRLFFGENAAELLSKNNVSIKIDGKNFLLFVDTLTSSNILVCAFPRFNLWKKIDFNAALLLILPIAIFISTSLYGFVLIFRRQKTENRQENLHIPEKGTVLIKDVDEGKKLFNNPKDKILLDRILLYISKNYPNPLLNLSCLARDFGTKESFLYHFFRSRLNESFSQYLENYRLEQAKTLLANEGFFSVTTLSLGCGYSNSQTFRRAFKKKYGLTPSEYRETLIEKKQE